MPETYKGTFKKLCKRSGKGKGMKGKQKYRTTKESTPENLQGKRQECTQKGRKELFK